MSGWRSRRCSWHGATKRWETSAALVAHELKTLLQLARLQDDPSVGVERALELVDVLLEAASSRPPAMRVGSRLPG